MNRMRFVFTAIRLESVESVTRIGDTLVIAKRTPVNQQVERSLVPIALIPAGLDPVKPQALHPRLALPN